MTHADNIKEWRGTAANTDNRLQSEADDKNNHDYYYDNSEIDWIA